MIQSTEQKKLSNQESSRWDAWIFLRRGNRIDFAGGLSVGRVWNRKDWSGKRRMRKTLGIRGPFLGQWKHYLITKCILYAVSLCNLSKLSLSWRAPVHSTQIPALISVRAFLSQINDELLVTTWILWDSFSPWILCFFSLFLYYMYILY